MEEKQKDTNDKSRVILSIILIILLMISVISVTYAIFMDSKEGQTKNTVRTGSLTFSYTESSNGIYLENAMPMIDEVGKKLDRSKNNDGYFDFNVSSLIAGTNKIQYEVYATKMKVENQIDDRYVKIYLTDGNSDRPISGYDVEIPTYNSLKNSIYKEGSKQLYYGSFTSSGIQSFRLRIWLSENYNVPTVSEQFKIKVNVHAVNN